MSKKTHTRQDAKKQYLLTFATFKHAVPQALQKLKGNVNSLDISACTSLERETVAPLAVKHPHSARYSAAAREHMPQISRYHNAPDGAGLTNHTQDTSSNKEAEGETSTTLLVNSLRLTSWSVWIESFAKPNTGKPICTRFRKYEQICRLYSHGYQTIVHCFDWKIRGFAPCKTWYRCISIN